MVVFSEIKKNALSLLSKVLYVKNWLKLQVGEL